MKYIHETYDSISQLIQTVNSRPVNSVFKHSSRSSRTNGRDFTGTSSYGEAEGLLKDGWDGPVKDLKAEISKLYAKANVVTTKARPRNSVVGYAPCVPAAILGLPESMIATEKVPSKVKAVTIVYANSAVGSVGASKFTKAGAVVLKLVNDLELKGYRVRLLCEFWSSECGDENAVGRVSIKDWRQPLDLKKIAFPIAHPSMMRRIGFSYVETHPGLRASWSGGYGYTTGNKKSYEQMVSEFKKNGLLTENEYYITMQLVEKCNYDSERVMKKAGITLK